MIAERPYIIQSDDNGVRVDICSPFLAAYSRKLYVVDKGSVFHIPEGHAHAHGSEDLLIPIGGDISLAYQTSRGTIEYLELVPGRHYVIPPNVPHQVQIDGGILESLFPTTVFTLGIPMREFPGGFFGNNRAKGVEQNEPGGSFVQQQARAGRHAGHQSG